MTTREKLKAAALAALSLVLYLIASTMEYHDDQAFREAWTTGGTYYDN